MYHVLHLSEHLWGEPGKIGQFIVHLIGIYSATLCVEMDQVLPKHGGVMGTYIKGRDVVTLSGAVLQVRVHTADVFQNVFILFTGRDFTEYDGCARTSLLNLAKKNIVSSPRSTVATRHRFRHIVAPRVSVGYHMAVDVGCGYGSQESWSQHTYNMLRPSLGRLTWCRDIELMMCL